MELAQISLDGYTPPSQEFTDYRTLPTTLVSRLLLYAIVIAGLYFFLQLLLAGFAYMTAMGDEAKLKENIKRITNAFIGLLVILASYFVLQMLQAVTGTNIT